MTNKEGSREEDRVNNGTITKLNMPDEAEDDLDETEVVMKPGARKSQRLRYPERGSYKLIFQWRSGIVNIKSYHLIVKIKSYHLGQDLIQWFIIFL